MKKVKITVLKTTLDKELAMKYFISATGLESPTPRYAAAMMGYVR